MSPNTKPPWARLYAFAALWFVLLIVAFLLPVSSGWQKLIAYGVILSFFTFLMGWLYVHRAALAREDWEKHRSQAHLYQRDVPLQPVQSHYLRVMDRSTNRERKACPSHRTHGTDSVLLVDCLSDLSQPTP